MLKVKKFNPDAILPKKAHIDDAGWDLSSVEDAIIPPQGWRLVDLGIGVIIPSGSYGRIAPRSSVSMKGIFVNAGVIDRNYRGKCKVLLFNFSNTDEFKISKGDRIAQLILERIMDDIEVMEVNELDESERGQKGFGSSGI